MDFIKWLIFALIIIGFAYPFIPMTGFLERFSFASRLKIAPPHNKRNFIFVILALLLFIPLLLVYRLLDGLVNALYAIPFVGELLKNGVNGIPSQTDYILFMVRLVVINLLVLYAFMVLKAIVKKLFIDLPSAVRRKRLFGFFKRRKKKKEEKKTPPPPMDGEETPEEDNSNKRIPVLELEDEHTETDGKSATAEDKDATPEKDGEQEGEKEKKPRYGKLAKAILSLFFEGEEFEFARGWVMRARMILQTFVYLIQAVYLLFVVAVTASTLFPLPTWAYDLLIDVLHVQDWYLYPMISILLLQEICNTFKTGVPKEEAPDLVNEEAREEEKREREAKVRRLFSLLRSRFDSEHSLRYYPEVMPEDMPEYECTNLMYKSALDHIKGQMRLSSGHVVQSYMECLDAIYSDNHVYFSASFYSELGEYLIAYTYIRLLAGARQVFVVSDPKEKETLRTYISDRLMRMTGSSAVANWRVYTAEERLDQADVLVASPEDFVGTDIIDQHPAFFDEVCNAIFIDADKLISLNSYLCPIMATKLKRATKNRIRFVFLSLDLLKGFAAGSLPRFFCVDKVLSFSSAKENEAVACVLWNRESKSNRIYNKHGQKSAGLETIIAEQACRHGVDGVRLITSSPIEHAEREMLSLHGVEINNFYKNVVNVNYMIYSDERCNLSAALYACTRFRGREKSVVHILSKPYLLREYFMSKAIIEDHITRSSFIQPRVTEHVERHKLSLLRIFCDATSEEDLPLAEFETRVREVIATTIERDDFVSSAFCRNFLRAGNFEERKIEELAAYLVAGIYDNDPIATAEEDEKTAVSSAGKRAKNFYVIVDATRSPGALTADKFILFNRTKEVFHRVLACNKRVELRLNDEVIGLLETFPSRVKLEYTEGQSLIYNNAEYEIDHIASDGSAIYLRHENINLKNCLDTVLLRHFTISEEKNLHRSAVLNNSRSVLEEIRVNNCELEMQATTFGFYSLTSDRQTLDFYRGVEGNLNYDNPQVRDYKKAKALHVTLSARMECNDGMRMLLAAVFNEFIRTLFPAAYRCVAICPVLEQPLTGGSKEQIPLEHIKRLYPFFNNDAGKAPVETDKSRMQFYFINDCQEDVGVLDWFYDHSARYMQEFLANIYSYLYWLKLRLEKKHYIYFGGDELPECYDLEGCCQLLGDFNLRLSDEGERDFDTAGDDTEAECVERCAFCHQKMESGRYSYFNAASGRFICCECDEKDNLVYKPEQLEELYLEVREYVTKTYPSVLLPEFSVDFDSPYPLPAHKCLSENYYRIDYLTKTLFVERGEPKENVRVSILRALISFWQVSASLSNHYADAQLYFEELKFLRTREHEISADWIYEHLTDDLRAKVDEIADSIARYEAKNGEKTEEPVEETTEETTDETAETTDETAETTETEDAAEDEAVVEESEDEDAWGRPACPTSFAFMQKIGAELETETEEDNRERSEEDGEEEHSDTLYDPNRVPRFWKRYLRGEKLDDGKEEDVSEAENDAFGNDGAADTEDGTDDTPAAEDTPVTDDAAEDTPETDDTAPTDEPALEEDPEEDGDYTLPAPCPPLDTETPEATETAEDESADAPSDTVSEEAPVAESAEDKKRRKAEEKQRKKEERERKRREKREQRERDAEERRDRAVEERLKRARRQAGLLDEEEEELPLDSTATEDAATATDATDKTATDGKTTKEKKGFFDWFKRKKKAKTDEEKPQDADETATDDRSDATDKTDATDKSDEKPADTEDTGKKGKDKGDGGKDKKKRWLFGKKVSLGERMVPYEEEEKTNPKIRFYNEIARAAYNFSEKPVSYEGLSLEEADRIWYYVAGDYPELFWMSNYYYTGSTIGHNFRCKDANGKLDMRQIKQKRKEIQKGAKFFTRGITKKTDPYQALLTIYRRVILTVDYDDVGLNAHVDRNHKTDDVLRSLHSALVSHKIVCAGYAVAMQYLLQSVGIVCGYVVSEDSGDGCHAFNILKLGKYCYYLDATWGDSSSTQHNNHKNLVKYDYCCVPYKEFVQASPGYVPYHVPRKEFYPNLETFSYTNHEYCRYHGAYLKSYDETAIATAFARAADAYDRREMGDFTVSLRSPKTDVSRHIEDKLWGGGRLRAVIDLAKTMVKTKKARALLDGRPTLFPAGESCVTTFAFSEPEKKKK